MLGIIISLPAEVPNIEKYFEKNQKISVNGFSGYIFEVMQKNVVLLFCGVGKANAASATMSLINNFSVSSIINIGSAGSISEKLNPNVFFVPSSLNYIDVDASCFGYKINQVPHEPESFELSSRIRQLFLEIIKEYQENFIDGSCGTSDSFVSKENLDKFNVGKCIAVDMESTAIAQVCYKMKIEFACVKFISDSIYADENSSKQWSNNVNQDNKLMSEIIFNVANKYIYLFDLEK